MQMGGGIKIARVLTGQWVLLAARTDAAVQHPCRCFEKEILCATQKPQGVLRSLRLLTVSLYHFLQGAFEGPKKEATTDGCLFHLVGVLTVRLIQSINLQVYTVQHCLYL